MNCKIKLAAYQCSRISAGCARSNTIPQLEELLDAWRVNNVVTLELLDMCSADTLDFKPGKGKTVRSNFVHIIGVRRLWAEESAKKEAAIIPRLDWKSATIPEIEEGLTISSEVMATVFHKKHESTKTNRFSLIKFFAYCIAHEAHHRSQIEIALRINGAEPDDKDLFALWDWSKK